MKNKRTFTFMVFDIHSKESLLPHSYHLQIADPRADRELYFSYQSPTFAHYSLENGGIQFISLNY